MNYREEAEGQVGPRELFPSKAEHQSAISERTQQLKRFKEDGLSGRGRTPATPVKDHRTSNDYRSPLVTEHMQEAPGPEVRAGLLAQDEPIDDGAFDDEFAVVEVAPVMEALMAMAPPMPAVEYIPAVEAMPQPMPQPMPQQAPMQAQPMPMQQQPMPQPMPQQQAPMPARDWWSML